MAIRLLTKGWVLSIWCSTSMQAQSAENADAPRSSVITPTPGLRIATPSHTILTFRRSLEDEYSPDLVCIAITTTTAMMNIP